MQPRQSLPGGIGMLCRTKGRPRNGIFVEINALWDLVYLVRPLTDFNCGVASRRCNYPGHACPCMQQMRHKGMLFMQAIAVAHSSMMALYEDQTALCVHHTRS